MKRILPVLLLLALLPLLAGALWSALADRPLRWPAALAWTSEAESAEARPVPADAEAEGRVPSHTPAVRELLRAARSAEPADAVRLLQEGLSDAAATEAPVLHLAAARAAGRAGDLVAARRHAAAPEILASHLRGRALLLQAELLGEDAPLESRITLLRRAVEGTPGPAVEAEARRALVRTLLEAERGDEALEGVELLEPLAPALVTEDEVLFLRARAYRLRGQIQRAQATLDALYFHHPTSSWNSRAARLPWRKARARSLRKSPSIALADRLERAAGLFDAGWYTSALAEYERILEHYPRQGDPDLMHLRAGISAVERRKWTTALSHLRAVAGDRGDLSVEALYQQGRVHRRRKQAAELVEAMEAVSEGAPGSLWEAKAMLELGAWYEDRDPPRARSAWRRAVAAAPSSGPGSEAMWRLGWSLYHDYDFEEARDAFLSLARTGHHPHERAAGLYWAAKAEGQRGQAEGRKALLGRVTSEYPNDFYATRARQALGLPVDEAPVSLSAVGTDHVLEELRGLARRQPPDPEIDAALLRVRDLAAVGEVGAVLEELAAVEAALGPEPEIDGLRLDMYGESGDHLEAFLAFRRIYPNFRSRLDIPLEHWKAVYPRRFVDLVESNARERGLDPDFVLAVIHQESVFDPRATSHVGARGLMQIMPSTGREISRRLAERGYRTSHLYEPGTNVRFGTFYLSDLLTTFEGRPELALAGYNAGGGRVRRWTAGGRGTDPDVFVESIPFDETRNYVKRILNNVALYKRLYPEAVSVEEVANATGIH